MKLWLLNQLNQLTLGFYFYGIPHVERRSLYGTKIMKSKCHLFCFLLLNLSYFPLCLSQRVSLHY